jgi:septal ring factor EnvC (AmiA/AmiB activator)
MEKFKAESQAQFQKELQEKTSEVEVLKEMIKGVQVSLKAKETEIKRMKAAKTVITQQDSAFQQNGPMSQRA